MTHERNGDRRRAVPVAPADGSRKSARSAPPLTVIVPALGAAALIAGMVATNRLAAPDAGRVAAEAPSDALTAAQGTASDAPGTAGGRATQARAGDPALPGGATTVAVSGTNAFSQPAANLSFSDRGEFSVGNSFFRNPWVSAPASTDARDGLGPLFNTNTCQGCHIKDGRGSPPAPGATHGVSTLIRLGAALPAQRGPDIGRAPDPVYGGQLQDFALPGVAPEARVDWQWETATAALADGESVALRRPVIELTDLAYGPMAEATQLGPRVAPAMIGLGLLEAIPARAIVAGADPEDRDGDGVSGRPNRVWDVTHGERVLGRFGWKAEQPTVRQQAAAAFLGDMGLTNPIFPTAACSEAQASLCDLPHGGTPEVAAKILDAVTFYASHLAPPKREGLADAAVRRGEQVFDEVGCGACHTPTWTTAEDAPPALADQVIYPYTDLLLHDMGDALADGIHVFDASGSEWRTPPLWGLGRHQEVNGNRFLLHDGRARSPLEAILWHGGEARASRERVVRMGAEERNALLAFLDSL